MRYKITLRIEGRKNRISCYVSIEEYRQAQLVAGSRGEEGDFSYRCRVLQNLFPLSMRVTDWEMVENNDEPVQT
jgi:hypothetical protein